MPIRGDDDARGGLLDEILLDLSDAPQVVGGDLPGTTGESSIPQGGEAALHGRSGDTQCCDEPGCTGCAVCGFPTHAGYRMTCASHARGWVGEAASHRAEGGISGVPS